MHDDKKGNSGFHDNVVTKDDATVEPGTTNHDCKATAKEDVETRCGYFSCRPNALQKFNNPKVLLACLCWFGVTQGFAVNGINNVNTTSLERRFQLPSSRVAFISSAYDLSGVVFGIVISFLGSGLHKARWVAMASVVMAAGSFIMALPHFTTGRYEWGQDETLTCSKDGDEPRECDSHLQSYLFVLILGQLLHGVGGITLYSLGVSLIDDSVPTASSPLYLAIFYTVAFLGPTVGFLVGGELLSIYVDFDRVPSDQVRIDPEDPRWVGAWWMGFLVASGMFLAGSLPISLFGAELPTAKHVRETRVSQTHGDDGTMATAVTDPQALRDLKNLPKAVWRLFKNPPFMFISLVGASEFFVLAGFGTFLPKLFQNQFGTTAGWGAMLAGIIALPGVGGGQLVGGLICKRMQLKVKGCIRVGIVSCIITILVAPVFWAQCGIGKVAGVTAPYHNGSDVPSTRAALVSECNADCHCHTEMYEPVCDHLGIQYFSPCHAGCLHKTAGDQSYTNCSCIPPPVDQVNVNVTLLTAGKCDSDCKLIYVFLVLVFVFVFCTVIPAVPATMTVLRCIHDSERTLGLGIKLTVFRLLGSFPGPIVFGALIDGACVLWQDKCGEEASCWIYDNNLVGRNLFILVICMKVLSLLLFSLAHCTYKPPVTEGTSYAMDKDNETTGSVSTDTTTISTMTSRVSSF